MVWWGARPLGRGALSPPAGVFQVLGGDLGCWIAPVVASRAPTRDYSFGLAGRLPSPVLKGMAREGDIDVAGL